MLLKGGTLQANIQRLLFWNCTLLRKGWKGPRGTEARREPRRTGTGMPAGGVKEASEEPAHSRLCECENRIRPGSKSAEDGPGVLAKALKADFTRKQKGLRWYQPSAIPWRHLRHDGLFHFNGLC